MFRGLNFRFQFKHMTNPSCLSALLFPSDHPCSLAQTSTCSTRAAGGSNMLTSTWCFQESSTGATPSGTSTGTRMTLARTMPQSSCSNCRSSRGGRRRPPAEAVLLQVPTPTQASRSSSPRSGAVVDQRGVPQIPLQVVAVAAAGEAEQDEPSS